MFGENPFLGIWRCLFIELICVSCFPQPPYNTSSLVYVHVIFRHGDRTPDSYCPFFNPGLNESYWPDGFGALTLLGKNQEYDIGCYLRKRYDSWLGKIYYPEIVYTRATDYPRTKMSLQLVLAGLFPPAPGQRWNWKIHWQPIPYNYPTGKDKLMGFPLLCQEFRKEFDRVYISPEAQRLLVKDKTLLDFLTEQTGPLSINPVVNVYYLHNCLYVWDYLSIPLPSWAKFVYPFGTKDIALKFYMLNSFNPLLTKLSGGQLLGRVLSDAEAIMSNQFSPSGQRISLFSGHEYNIAHLLIALRSFSPPQWPNYASYVIFELHENNGVYGFKIFLQNSKIDDPVALVIPGCAPFCPIAEVKRLLADNIPDEETERMC